MWVVDQLGTFMYRDLPSPSRSARPQARYGNTSSAMSSSSQWLASHSESQAHQFPNKQAPLSTCSNGRAILRIQAKHGTPGTTVSTVPEAKSTYAYYRFRLRTMMGNLGVFLGGSRRRLERQPITRWWSPSASVPWSGGFLLFSTGAGTYSWLCALESWPWRTTWMQCNMSFQRLTLLHQRVTMWHEPRREK
jgi:hypothetical protein